MIFLLYIFSSQEPDSRLWSYMYPSKYSEASRLQEEERWKEERERERKAKEEKPRVKEEVKEGVESRMPHPPEEHQGGGKEPRIPHMQFPSPLAQHQGYMPYMQGPYAYSQGFDPNHPGYRGMPAVMMQNYPGKTTEDRPNIRNHQLEKRRQREKWQQVGFLHGGESFNACFTVKRIF